MPKANTKKYKLQIQQELRKWFGKSRQMKTLSHISYGKIKASLMSMEKCCDLDEMAQFRREIGKAFSFLSFYYLDWK